MCTQFRKSKKQQKKRTVVQMNNISYMMVPVQQRSHYFTNQQVSFWIQRPILIGHFKESLGNQLLQFWEFYRDPSSEQNSQKLLTLTQAPTSTTVSTKIGSTFRDWMLRKNRKSGTVVWLEDRFSLYMYTVSQNFEDVHVVFYLRPVNLWLYCEAWAG